MVGVETKEINKSKGTSIMKRTCFPPLESCKVEGKLLTPSRIMQIMWHGHKEFHEQITLRAFNSLY